jgi:hypothetical protein
MLVKYGPSGSSWAVSEPAGPGNPAGISLLALLTQNVYQDLQAGKIQIPFGGGHYRYGMQDQTQLANALAGADPLAAMLQADAQNRSAAWQAMGGPDGSGLAKMLLNGVNGDLPGLDGRFVQGGPNDQGSYPSFFTMQAPGKPVTGDYSQVILSWPDQKALGQFLDAATSAPRGTSAGAGYSARAAVAIISNLQAPFTDNGTIVAPYDPAVQQALTSTFLRYLPDLAASAGNPAQVSAAGQALYAQGHPWVVSLSQAQLSTCIQALSADPANYGYLKGIIATKMGTALGLQLNGVTDGSADLAADFASLYGRFTTEAANLHYTAAQDQVGIIPVVGPLAGKALSWDQKLQFLGVPQIPQFSTDNAANALAQGRQEFTDQQLKTMIPLVQGLVQAGVVKPDPRWYQNGQIVCNDAFNQWWTANKGMPIQDKSLPGSQFDHLDSWYQKTVVWQQLQHDAFSTGR